MKKLHPAVNGLRVAMDEETGESWFVAKDVRDALGFTIMYSSLALLDEDEKALHSMEGNRGLRNMVIVSEPGLYSLILLSSNVKQFKRLSVGDSG